MPPIPLLIALMMAFALGDQFPGAPIGASEIFPRLLEAALSLLLAAGISLGVGLGFASTVRKRGGRHLLSLRFYSMLSSAVSVMNLGVYAWILFGLGWVSLVRTTIGLRNTFILDELLILLPYVLAEVAGWCGLYPASRVLAVNGSELGPIGYLSLRFRLGFGLVLPPLLCFAFLGDLAQSLFGKELSQTWWFEGGSVLVIGLVVLTLSPAFVRLALSTHRLPDGPLRDQLTRQGRRLGFRTTDILVWETRGSILNAVVTGLFPWFRYVLLSDGLIDQMDPTEIAAIYGHEVGHIRHRHFAAFGLFMLGSTGALALAFFPLEAYLEPWLARQLSNDTALLIVDLIAFLVLAMYFFFAFGALSRLLERQADVFGCRAVSCDSEICPPHTDLDLDELPSVEANQLCPVGIQTFVEALRHVALMNGIDMNKFSWRHGSISDRIAFLESLIDEPERERRFQTHVTRFTAILGAALIAATLASILTGSFDITPKL